MVLSNLSQERDIQQAMEAGALAYFVKSNLSLEDLVKRVEEVFPG
jgi:DNA-binding NarL/FixJ family response regulator